MRTTARAGGVGCAGARGADLADHPTIPEEEEEGKGRGWASWADGELDGQADGGRPSGRAGRTERARHVFHNSDSFSTG